MKDKAAASEGNCMTGVVAALVACNAVVSVGEDVDDFAFSFIAPLKSDDGDVLFHDNGLPGSTKV